MKRSLSAKSPVQLAQWTLPLALALAGLTALLLLLGYSDSGLVFIPLVGCNLMVLAHVRWNVHFAEQELLDLEKCRLEIERAKAEVARTTEVSVDAVLRAIEESRLQLERSRQDEGRISGFQAELRTWRRSQTEQSRPGESRIRTAVEARIGTEFHEAETATLLRTLEVFGESTRALAWMRENNPALQDQPPILAIRTEEGRREVLNILGRIQHGVIS